MESDVARYLASLEKAVPDCKDRLKELQIIIECFNDKKCDPKSLMRGLELVHSRSKG